MENSLTYTMNGDYQVPDLKLTEQRSKPLGKYGRMRKAYLKEHRPLIYNQLLLTEKLYPHLLEIDETANGRLEQMMPQLAAAAGATEQLKARDPMKWVGLMNTCKAQALLESSSPLADVYRYFEKLETGYMDVIRDSIENRADDACKAQAELRKAAIYPHSAAYAKEHGELEQYRASNRVNLQCKEAIEAAVREHFDGMYLRHDAAKGVIETYGMDRVMLVLANTVQLQDWDGRYSPRNKEWAKTIPNYNSDTVRCGYTVNSHPAVLNGFIDLVREEHLRRQPLTAEDIQAEAERIMRELYAPDVSNSPHGTHYIVRISPEFLNRAGSKDYDRLMNLLPFRSLAFTGMKGLPRTYATILANERTAPRSCASPGPLFGSI